MGFSLSRALAGAIAGGAGAVSQIADQRIREVAAERDDARQLERQQMLMREQDEIIANREQRVAEAKARFEADKKKEVSSWMNSQFDALRAAKINPGSVEGQALLAEAAGRAGYQDYADKFFDNSTKLGQIRSTEELRKAEQAQKLEMTRMRRDLAASDRASAQSEKIGAREKEVLKEINEVEDSFTLKRRDRDGKEVTDATATTEAKRLKLQMLREGTPPDQILNNMLNFKSQFDSIATDPKLKEASGAQLVDATHQFMRDMARARVQETERLNTIDERSAPMGNARAFASPAPKPPPEPIVKPQPVQPPEINRPGMGETFRQSDQATNYSSLLGGAHPGFVRRMSK